MARRGRSGANGGPAAKRLKTDLPTIDGVVVQWEWEGDKAKWTGYNANIAATITDSYNNADSDVTFDVAPGTQMKIIFEKSVQKNPKTGWERRLRCCVQETDSKDYFSWEWLDEHGRWNPYNAKNSILLEKAQQGGEKNITIEAGKRGYTINLAKMEQVNDDTGVMRKVQRIKSTVVPPETPEEKESKDVTAAIAAVVSGAGDAGKGDGEKAGTSQGRKSGAKGKSGASKGKSGAAAETKSTVRTVVVKGAAPVDPVCFEEHPRLNGKVHVHSEGKAVYDCMLNQTNLQNNNNKFYLIQLLKEDSATKYHVWMRWGRVGKTGQKGLFSTGPDLDEAKDIFCSKFKDKTKNDWSQRAKFSKVAGKYDMVALDYSVDTATEDTTDGPQKPIDVPDSKLDKKLQDLVNLICDVKSMEEAVVEMKYDAKKAPLGKLNQNQIKAGYAALKKIDDCITNNKMGQQLIQACDEFYTRIPHDFGMRPPTVIRTKPELKQKIQLLEALSDIEVAMTILKKKVHNENPVDAHYNMLNCKIDTMDKKDPMYKILDTYLQHTHASTHQQYKMDIMDVFEVKKNQEEENFDDRGNRMLLWHGSRLTNWMGILSQGLRIAPPEAPVTGYMFGKGIYFADMSSKSANYCYPTRAKNIGLVLLCEVALGKCNELLAADYGADKLPKGKDSVWGKGKIAPDYKLNHVTPDGVAIPQGKEEDTGVVNPNGYTLNYNEFIVYDPSQVKMKYLMKVKFNFK